MRSAIACLSFILIIPATGISQNTTVRGQVVETFSKVPLPFVHITINDSLHRMTDIDGRFHIASATPVSRITFSHYMHRPVTLLQPADSLLVELNNFELFSFENATDPQTAALISKVIYQKKYNDIRLLNAYSYATYNKFTLSSGKNDETNKFINKYSGRLPIKMKTLQNDQHLLIVESVTEKQYLNFLHQKELISGAKSSNITIPTVFIQTTQLHAFSIYDTYLKVGGKEFLSPLMNKSLRQYAFTIIDQFAINEETIYVVKFNPLPGKNFEALKGILYINSKNDAIQNFIAGPAEEGSTEMKIIQSYKLHDNQRWFPDRTKTLSTSGKGSSGMKFTATGNTYITDVKINDRSLGKSQFDEVILEYNKESETKDEGFWDKKRKEPLTHNDSATYKYYAAWDSKRILEKFLRIGEHLSYGFMPVGKVNIDMNKLFNYNDVEGVRLGLGLHTNERFSERTIVGGYFGYGFRDKRVKFGADYAYLLFPKKQVWYKIAFSHELREAGRVDFAFDQYQYSSEVIRKFRLRILDLSTELDNSIIAHPFKYMDASIGISHSRNITTYTYSYKGEPAHILDFSEIRAGFRYAYGEQFIKFLSNKKSLGTLYPVIYFQYSQGLNLFFGDYSYAKYDCKIEQSIKIPVIGTSTFQLIGGITNGDAPYTKLYNMRGSLKSPSFVIHNSFETMRYNEFLSDRYIALFFSHNLGKIRVDNPHIQPTIILMHNMGIGGLSNKNDHTNLPFAFKTMEKGYVESGAFADNVLVVNLTGMRTGFGAGLFMRYGPYASLKASDNIVFKFSANFGI
jgi:hypothetical protein